MPEVNFPKNWKLYAAFIREAERKCSNSCYSDTYFPRFAISVIPITSYVKTFIGLCEASSCVLGFFFILLATSSIKYSLNLCCLQLFTISNICHHQLTLMSGYYVSITAERFTGLILLITATYEEDSSHCLCSTCA